MPQHDAEVVHYQCCCFVHLVWVTSDAEVEQTRRRIFGGGGGLFDEDCVQPPSRQLVRSVNRDSRRTC